MASIVLGIDKNLSPSEDMKCMNTVADILTKAGHTVEKLERSPTPFADYSYGKNGKNPKGKIGVYLMAGSLVSVADLHGGNTGFKYAYFGIRGDASPRFNNKNAFDTKVVNKDSDCTSICDKYSGMTYPQLNEKCKDKCQCIFGATPKELGDNILSAMGGGTGDSSSGSSEDSSGSNSGNVKECIQNLLKHWDGDVECVIRGKNVYINQVRDPEKSYSCALIEGVNVFNDNVTVTDINPNTPNHLVVNWTGGSIEYRDELLIVRFGEHLKTMQAVKKVVQKVKVKKDTDSDSSSDSGSSSSSDSGTSSSSDSGSDSGNTSNNNSSNTGDGNTQDIGGKTYYVF